MSQPTQKPQFLAVFRAYRPSELLRQQLEQWQVVEAVIDKNTRTIRARLLCPPVSPTLLKQVEGELGLAYGVSAVLIVEPEEEERPPMRGTRMPLHPRKTAMHLLSRRLPRCSRFRKRPQRSKVPLWMTLSSELRPCGRRP